MDNDHRSLTENRKVSQKDHGLQSNTETEPNRALVLISFGESAAASTLLERAILSIRRRGAFEGPIVIITDAPPARYSTAFDENVKVLSYREDDMKLHYFADEGMKYKRFKTMILDYIDLEPELNNIELVYYMDIDMLMGASFYDLSHDLETKYGITKDLFHATLDNRMNSEVAKLYMFQDPGNFAVNSGFFIVDRQTSRPCLELWRAVMDSLPRRPRDQQSLNIIAKRIESHKDTECELVRMEPKNYISFIENENSLVKMTKSLAFPNLIHIFNSAKAEKFSAEATEKFVNIILNLSDEEKRKKKYGKAVITPSYNNWANDEIARAK